MKIEIERKYEIEMPDEDKLAVLDNTIISYITQTYLKSPSGEERRVRRIVSVNDKDDVFKESYTYTIKRNITNLSREEIENNISFDEYEQLIKEMDTSLGVIQKKRISFSYKHNIIEIDIYPFWDDTCIMEIEIQDEKEFPEIPDFINIIKDVTGNKKYSNYALAANLSCSTTSQRLNQNLVDNIEEKTCLEQFFNTRIEEYGYKYPIAIGQVYIHNKESLIDSNDFKVLYDLYGLKDYNHHNESISTDKKINIAKEFFDQYRTLFQREEERIISTEAFRRLQYKTQVMVNSTSDDQRTRLLHSLEVEKISRKIALALKANCELTQAIAIGHDIGHTPFGHAGERAICNYLENELSGAFSHALQSVKVIDYLCSHRTLKPLGIRGLGVSKHVLEGILKHDTDSFSDDISNPSFVLQYDCKSLLIPVGYKKYNIHKDFPVLIGGVESQIVCWADKIAYLSHDWEEFVSIGALEKMLNRVNTIVIQMTYMCTDQYIEVTPHCCDFSCEMESIKTIVKNISILNSIYNQKGIETDECKKSKEYFFDALPYIDQIIDITRKYKFSEQAISFCDRFKDQNNYYFSTEQYQTLFSFFSITKAWITITGLYPEKVGNKMDAIFTFYNYLCKLLPHTTTPALINKIIEKSKKNLIGKSRDDVIYESNKRFMSLDCRCKDNIKKSYLINFDKKVYDAVKQVGDFIKIEYNHSTRIENMNWTAEQILNALFDFYFSNPQMLPLKQRNKIEQEISVEKFKKDAQDSLANKLMSYYWFKLCKNRDWKEFIERLMTKLEIKNPNLTQEETKDKLTSLKSDEEFYSYFKPTEKAINDTIILRVIADYIAGMTDRMAELKYNEIVSSSAQWCQEYTERSTFSVY